VGPLEQINLAQQASDAAAAVDELEAELSAASASFESKRALSQEGQMVAQRAVDEAEARVKTARARLAGARRKLDGLRDAEHATDVGLTPLPLKITRGGQVVEVLAAPGEAVESGQPLMRVTNLEHLTANIELPAGETWNPTDAPVTLTLPAREDARCTAHVATQGPRAGVTTRGESWRLAIEQNPAQIRPGAPLVAYLPRNGEPLEGVVVPRRALVRHGGLAWVYVRRADTVFERREVDLAFPMSDGWFATSGLVSGDQVVTVGAQELLSEQLKEQIEREEEAAE
jgi:multidrug efflux pump subunit AcrA (membrane-fusion protein)